MPAPKPRKPASYKKPETNEKSLQLKLKTKANAEDEFQVHSLGKGRICDTEGRGHAQPSGRSLLEIVVHVSEGFIPLWSKGTIIKWRFQERSLNNFQNAEEIRQEIRKLFGEALLLWGDAAPVKFKEDVDVWDFEIVMKQSDACSISGCVLASAFFPDAGRHEFVLYPKMFTQSRKEQVDTFIHEIGHIFGLRHFFAKLRETGAPSEVFGNHTEFTIMNYGVLSELGESDKIDLKKLYESVWNGSLKEINGTPIRLMKPYSSFVSA